MKRTPSRAAAVGVLLAIMKGSRRLATAGGGDDGEPVERESPGEPRLG
ncbi:MAG: hypothetical protein U0232_08175 [Thermomicrobiales bacterium]